MTYLLWKDYRLNQFLLVLAIIFLVAPMAVAALGLVWVDRPYFPDVEEFRNVVWYGCDVSITLSQLSLCLLAGNAFAAERVDRSSEFLATLPPTRTKILVSKLLVVLLTAAAVALTVYGAKLVLTLVSGEPWEQESPVYWAIGFAGFGAAWAASTAVQSPTLSVGVGVLSMVMLPAAVAALHAYGIISTNPPTANCIGGFTLGFVAFTTGCIAFLKQVEP